MTGQQVTIALQSRGALLIGPVWFTSSFLEVRTLDQRSHDESQYPYSVEITIDWCVDCALNTQPPFSPYKTHVASILSFRPLSLIMLFAQELVQKIIDHLESSPRTLTACSLTCRDWYPLARQYIHSKFIYDGSDACYARIIAYVHRPDLAELVRVLVVDPDHDDRRLRWCTRSGPNVELELVAFPKVEELTLLYITWSSRSSSFREYITTQLPLVKTLHLGGADSPVRFEGFAALTSTIKSFSKDHIVGSSSRDFEQFVLL